MAHWEHSPPRSENDAMTLKLTEHEYAAAFAVICESSRHHELIRDIVSRHVSPGLPPHASLLDIGAGNGVVARALAPMFSHVTLLEPNPQQLGPDPTQGLPAGSRVMRGSLMEAEGLGQHDLVLCSHVLYHVERSAWPDFVMKLLAHTRPGGYTLIALMAPRGQNHELHCEFNPEYSHSGHLAETLVRLGTELAVYPRRNAFRTTSAAAMLSLCRFFALVDCYTETQLASFGPTEQAVIQARIAAQADRCRTSDCYRLEQAEDHVLIRRG
jgi:SAM-dependent methyltransferase